jgi:polyphosphate glucokinase
MAIAPDPHRENILAIDIGATGIKFGVVDPSGHLVEPVRRIATPYPCLPDRLIEVVVRVIQGSGCLRVGIGFPGELVDGIVIEPGNLSRPGGITTEIDPRIHEAWLGFNLQQAFRKASPQDIRVVNDAALAALGYCDGVGREIVFTLGTGFGIALVVDGSIERIRDVGGEIFRDGQTYDQLLGELSRSQDQARWGQLLLWAVENFVEEFGADTVHIGGGNARLVDLSLFGDAPYRIEVNDNLGTLRGAAKLFQHAESESS